MSDHDFVLQARRYYYAHNPDVILAQRLASAANLLAKHGLISEQLQREIRETVHKGGAVHAAK